MQAVWPDHGLHGKPFPLLRVRRLANELRLAVIKNDRRAITSWRTADVLTNVALSRRSVALDAMVVSSDAAGAEHDACEMGFRYKLHKYTSLCPKGAVMA